MDAACDGTPCHLPIFTRSFRAELQTCSGGEALLAAYLQFFKRIAVALATHASNQVVDAQVEDIIARIPHPASQTTEAVLAYLTLASTRLTQHRSNGPAIPSSGTAGGGAPPSTEDAIDDS